jgi:hypothetical protein
MTVNLLTTEALADAAELLRDKIAAKKAEFADLAEDLRRAERELQLIAELIRVRGEGLVPDESARLPSAPSSELTEVVSDGSGPSLAEAVVGVLRRQGKAMHIQELTVAVRKAGIPIPGRGESANVIAHIRSHPEVVRPVRGVYGLREWGIQDAVARPRKRRRRATRRARSPKTVKGVDQSRRPAASRSSRGGE